MGYPHIRGTVVAAEWQPSFIHLWLGIGCPDFLRPFEDTPPPSAIVTLEYPDALRRIRPASCVRGRVHEAPSGNQAHFFHRHNTVTNRPPEAETA